MNIFNALEKSMAFISSNIFLKSPPASWATHYMTLDLLTAPQSLTFYLYYSVLFSLVLQHRRTSLKCRSIHEGCVQSSVTESTELFISDPIFFKSIGFFS